MGQIFPEVACSFVVYFTKIITAYTQAAVRRYTIMVKTFMSSFYRKLLIQYPSQNILLLLVILICHLL